MTKISDKEISIPVNAVSVKGVLNVPSGAKRAVIFAHGSGSSHHSPRNQYVAKVLNDNGFATLLFDLLTANEDLTYENRFNIELLTKRLVIATNWLLNQSCCKNFKLGYFGASTGSAAAIRAASMQGESIKAIVSRGGRPDMAEEEIAKLKTPTLLIVGEFDDIVIRLNKQAQGLMTVEARLEIVPGATHLFEEPGTLEAMAKLALKWFKKYL